MRLFCLTLHKTYYEKGFFNVPVEHDRYVRKSNGPVTLILGSSGVRVEGRVDRRANTNGTPRIMGGAKLRDWFQEHYNQGDMVAVDLISDSSIEFRAGSNCFESKSPTLPDGVSEGFPTERLGVEELARWRRRIVRFVASVYEGQSDSLGAKIGELSRSGKIPREIAALMRVVTEMRNAAEYNDKLLTENENLAVRSAMVAIIEWAASSGIAI